MCVLSLWFILTVLLRLKVFAQENETAKQICLLGIDSIQLTTINRKTQVHIPIEVCKEFSSTIILDLEPSRIFHEDLRIIHKHNSQEPDLNFKYNVYSTKPKDEKQGTKCIFGAFIVETDESVEENKIRMGFFIIEEDDKTYTFYSLLPLSLLLENKDNKLIIMRNKVFLNPIQARPEKIVVPVKLIFHHSIYKDSKSLSDFLSYSMLLFSALKEAFRLQSLSDVDNPYFVIKAIEIFYEPGQFSYNLPIKMAPLACLLQKKVKLKRQILKYFDDLDDFKGFNLWSNETTSKYKEEINLLTQEITNLKLAIAEDNEAVQASFLDEAKKEKCLEEKDTYNITRGLDPKMTLLACLLQMKFIYAEQKKQKLKNYETVSKHKEEMNLLMQEITKLKLAIANNNEAVQASFLDEAKKEKCLEKNNIYNLITGLDNEHALDENQITVLYANTHGENGDLYHQGLAGGTFCQGKSSSIVIDSHTDGNEAFKIRNNMGISAATLIHEVAHIFKAIDLTGQISDSYVMRTEFEYELFKPLTFQFSEININYISNLIRSMDSSCFDKPKKIKAKCRNFKTSKKQMENGDTEISLLCNNRFRFFRHGPVRKTNKSYLEVTKVKQSIVNVTQQPFSSSYETTETNIPVNITETNFFQRNIFWLAPVVIILLCIIVTLFYLYLKD
ncbi:hypothetical protein QYM36_013934 [Artemia franciscana]|uniref:Peptidase M12B domain-containing protein n=1 Tax=Artemia franciscana TaxID=6661 RepID=A0AA88HNL7_ARTSF|nr:hypothetical protein QYM36_013934 [Artemia franciscana]